MVKASKVTAQSQKQLAAAVTVAPFKMDTATWDSVQDALKLSQKHIEALKLSGFSAIQHLRAASAAQLRHVFQNERKLDVAELISRWLDQRCGVKLPNEDDDDSAWKATHEPQSAAFFC